jgi:hypothetical protein
MPETQPHQPPTPGHEKRDSLLAGLASGAAGDFTGRGPTFDALKRVRPDRWVVVGQLAAFLVQVSLIGATVLFAVHDSSWMYPTCALVVIHALGASLLAMRICRRRPDYLRSRARRAPLRGRLY